MDRSKDKAVIGGRCPGLRSRDIRAAGRVSLPERIGIRAQVLERRRGIARAKQEIKCAGLIASKGEAARCLAANVGDNIPRDAAKAAAVPNDLLARSLAGLDNVRWISQAVCGDARVEICGQDLGVWEWAWSGAGNSGSTADRRIAGRVRRRTVAVICRGDFIRFNVDDREIVRISVDDIEPLTVNAHSLRSLTNFDSIDGMGMAQAMHEQLRTHRETGNQWEGEAA